MSQELIRFKAALNDALPQIRTLLPDTMDERRFARIAMGFFSTKGGAKLAKCTPRSFVNVMVQIAELNLEPVLGMAYPVPFAGVATLIIGYQGYIELAYRSGLVRAIRATVVREGDEFQEILGLRPDIIHSAGEKRGAITHVYASAELMTGGIIFRVLDRAAIDKRRDVSPSASRSDSPWVLWEEDQVRKTGIRALFKMIPKSVHMARAAAMDDEGVMGRETRVIDVESATVAAPWDTPELEAGGDGFVHTDEPEPAPDAPKSGGLV